MRLPSTPRRGTWRALAVAAAILAACFSGSTAAVTVKVVGSASLTNSDSGGIASAYRQGALLAARKINETGVFAFADGQDLKLDLRIDDDEGRRELVDHIYDVDGADADLLLGPYGSQLSSTAIAHAHDVFNSVPDKFIMLAGASNPEFYIDENAELNGMSKFTTSVLADQYLLKALDILRGRGASTVGIVNDISIGESYSDVQSWQKMCDSAAKYARSIGFKVTLANSDQDHHQLQLMEQVNVLRARHADVLMGCGSFAKVVDIVISARALGFSPDALVVPYAASDIFVHAVGAPNANYIMSPTSWTPDINYEDCALFGSTENFVKEYRLAFDEEPLYQSAQAAAGIIAMMKAVATAGSVATPQVTEAMLQLDLPTFFGRLSFHPNGTRRDARVYTQQVMPLSDPGESAGQAAKNERFLRSQFKYVDVEGTPAATSVEFPVLSWREKELEVYPCGDGRTVQMSLPENSTGGEGAELYCQECEPGTYRDRHAVTCDVCPQNHYNTEYGQTACQPCPTGAACEGDGPLSQTPEAKPGYYKLPYADDLLVMECPVRDSCGASNVCSDPHTGILCLQCQPGYSRASGGKCLECGNNAWNAFAILLTIFMYLLYVKVLVVATIAAASRGFKATHAVILKICVNYAMFAGIAFAATDFEGMVNVLVGKQATTIMAPFKIAEFISNPVQAVGSIDCILEGVGVRRYQAMVFLGLALMPTAFILKVILGFLSKFLNRHLASRLASWRERLKRHREERDGDCIHVAGSPSPHSQDAYADCSRGVQSISMDCSPTSPFSPTSPSVTVRKMKTTKTTREVAAKLGSKLVNSMVVMSFLLHALVVRLLVTGLRCQQYDVLRLVDDIDVLCDEELQWWYISLAGLILYGFGTPLILFVALFRLRSRLLTQEVKSTYGFLYNGFELKYWYFEPFYMIRKVVVTLIFAFPSPWGRVLVMLLLACWFILMHLKTQPFDDRNYRCFDRLELFSLVAFAATLASRLIFDIREEFRIQYFYDKAFQNPAADTMLVSIPLMCHIWFVAFACWSLFRNTVLAYLSLKKDVVGVDGMPRLQMSLLKLERFKNHARFEKRPNSNGTESLYIDISDLHRQEREYLLEALSETTHRHMLGGKRKDKEKEFCPDELSQILREAVDRCEKARKKKQKLLKYLLAQSEAKQGLGQRLVHLKSSLVLVLYGPPDEKENKQTDEKRFSAELVMLLAEPLLGAWSCLRRPRAHSKGSPHGQPGNDGKRTQTNLPPPQEGSFPVEDFYDIIAKLWQDVCNGTWKRHKERNPCSPHHDSQESASPSSCRRASSRSSRRRRTGSPPRSLAVLLQDGNVSVPLTPTATYPAPSPTTLGSEGCDPLQDQEQLAPNDSTSPKSVGTRTWDTRHSVEDSNNVHQANGTVGVYTPGAFSSYDNDEPPSLDSTTTSSHLQAPVTLPAKSVPKRAPHGRGSKSSAPIPSPTFSVAKSSASPWATAMRPADTTGWASALRPADLGPMDNMFNIVDDDTVVDAV